MQKDGSANIYAHALPSKGKYAARPISELLK